MHIPQGRNLFEELNPQRKLTRSLVRCSLGPSVDVEDVDRGSPCRHSRVIPPALIPVGSGVDRLDIPVGSAITDQRGQGPGSCPFGRVPSWCSKSLLCFPCGRPMSA
eukprot:12667998-Heterocapsa_arctica.AAC.1